METIIWKWDLEPEWDPYTLLGSITIEDNNGNSIIDECTMIDAWASPILKGLKGFRDGLSNEYDLVDEPDPLIFKIDDDKKYIIYKDTKIQVTDEVTLLKSLKQVCRSVLTTIQEKSGIVDKYAVQILEEVIENC